MALVVGYLAGKMLAKNNDNSTELAGKIEEYKARLNGAESRNQELKGELVELRKDNEVLRSEKEKASVLVSRLETENKNARESIEAKQRDIQEMQEKFSKDFQILANKIFEEKTENFSKQSRASLDQLLGPLKEKISSFEKKVDETH